MAAALTTDGSHIMKCKSFNLLAVATLGILLSSDAYANVMNGKGSPCSDARCGGINSPGFHKTCTSIKQVCLSRHPGSAFCETAHANCMRTGVFVGKRRTINYVITQ